MRQRKRMTPVVVFGDAEFDKLWGAATGERVVVKVNCIVIADWIVYDVF
jgi:hypothetical protein